MSKEEIFNYFYTNMASLGVKNILLVLLGGLVIGGIIYLTYWITHKGVEYNSKFSISLVAILEISVVIMLMISSNIVISLGMVGALSIVRFRTAIKDSRDTVFIFWAIAEGLSVGSQNFKLALITTLFIALFLGLTTYIPTIWTKYLIVISGESEKHMNLSEIRKRLKPHVVDIKLRTANTNSEHEEVIFEVRTKGELDLSIINQLSELEGVDSVNWIVESGETLG